MRRRSRECALQALYQLDTMGKLGDSPNCEEGIVQDVLDNFWISFEEDAPVDKSFTSHLVRGVVDDLKSIDRALETVSRNWRLDRMTKIDRNLLRLGAFELQKCPETPRKVIINEALEIAKRFGGPDSSKFINGVLDQLGVAEPNVTES
jgi:transcription antitermination protein NusB